MLWAHSKWSDIQTVVRNSALYISLYVCIEKKIFLKGKKLFQNIMSFWKAINTTIALSTVVVTEVVKTTTKVTIPKFFLKIIYCSD